ARRLADLSRLRSYNVVRQCDIRTTSVLNTVQDTHVTTMCRRSRKEQHMKLKGLAAATSILALTLTLGACGGSDSDEPTLQQAIADGEISVGFAGEAPYRSERDGQREGASVAKAQAESERRS